MGILSDVGQFEAFNLRDMWGKVRDNPERLLLGAATPVGGALWGKILGKEDEYKEPIVNLLGGPAGSGWTGMGETGGVYERARNHGIDTKYSEKSHDIAEVIAGLYGAAGAYGGLGNAFGGGASGAAAGGGSAAGGGAISAGDAAALEAANASAAMGGTSGISSASGMGMSAPAAGGGFGWGDAAGQAMGLLGQMGGQQQQQPATAAPPPQQQPNNSLQRQVAMQRRMQQLRQKPRKSLAEQQELQELMRTAQGQM